MNNSPLYDSHGGQNQGKPGYFDYDKEKNKMVESRKQARLYLLSIISTSNNFILHAHDSPCPEFCRCIQVLHHFLWRITLGEVCFKEIHIF